MVVKILLSPDCFLRELSLDLNSYHMTDFCFLNSNLWIIIILFNPKIYFGHFFLSRISLNPDQMSLMVLLFNFYSLMVGVSIVFFYSSMILVLKHNLFEPLLLILSLQVPLLRCLLDHHILAHSLLHFLLHHFYYSYPFYHLILLYINQVSHQMISSYYHITIYYMVFISIYQN